MRRDMAMRAITMTLLHPIDSMIAMKRVVSSSPKWTGMAILCIAGGFIGSAKLIKYFKEKNRLANMTVDELADQFAPLWCTCPDKGSCN